MADLQAALLALDASSTEIIAVSSVPPPTGIDRLADALDAHRASLDLPARRLEARRRHALDDFIVEHGDRGLRALGGGHEAQRWLERQEAELDVPALLSALEARAQERP
jgi:LAO/AO transport system kinase